MSTTLKRKNPFIIYKLLALGFAVLIFIITSIPGDKLPGPPFRSSDKIVHALEFGLFGMLVFHAFRYSRTYLRPYFLTLCVCIPYAALDEIRQLYVPGRHCDIYDFVFDVLGIVIFAAVSAKINLSKENNRLE